MRRVAITGAGAISALGRNVTEFAESLREGRGGIGQIESTGVASLRFQNGAEVKNYSHQPYFEDRRADFMDRFAQFAVIAAREAVQDAGVACAEVPAGLPGSIWLHRGQPRLLSEILRLV